MSVRRHAPLCGLCGKCEYTKHISSPARALLRTHISFVYTDSTVDSAVELMGITGVGCNRDRLRSQIYRRVSRDNVQTLAEIYPCLESGALLREEVPELYQKDWQKASADSF